MSEEKTNKVEESTNVSQVDINLDEIFGMPGAESVTLPADEEADKTANVLSNKKTDMSFLDDEEEADTPAADSTDSTEQGSEDADKTSFEDLVTEVEGAVEEDEESEDEAPKKRGRKKIDGVADVFSKLITDEMLIPFIAADLSTFIP